MKIEKNAKYATIALYAFIVIAVSMIFYELLRNTGTVLGYISALAGYVRPVIYGVVIAFLLNPIMRIFEERVFPIFMSNKVKPIVKRSIAIALTYLVALLFVSSFISIVLPQVIASVNGLINNITIYINTFNLSTFVRDSAIIQWIMQLLEPDAQVILESWIEDSVGSLFMGIEGLLSTDVALLPQSLMNNMGSVIGIVGGAFNSAVAIISSVVNLLLGIIISIYFLADREKLFAQINKITLAIFPKRVSNLLYDIARESNKILSGFIIGKIIDSIIIGILSFIGMIFICPEYAVLIALIIGVTNIIPYFGPFIGAIPSFFLVLISETGGFGRSIVFLIFILALQQFDGNILGPKILGDTTGLSALWVVFSIMLFSGMLGVLGMFIGVPLFAVIYYIIKRSVAFLLRKKGVSTDTRDYASVKNPLIK